jgi:hypothetical protein
MLPDVVVVLGTLLADEALLLVLEVMLLSDGIV